MYCPQHTPGMNDWCLWQSVIHHCVLLILWEEERISLYAFNAVVVVDWYIHGVAAVKAERSSLFWFSEDIGQHYFCWAVHDFKLASSILLRMK
jgi:hypothetical protein